MGILDFLAYFTKNIKVHFENGRSIGSRKISLGGFTFIEMVVAVAIMAVISSVAVSYSSDIRKQLALARTQSQVVSILYRARSLSQNFLLTPPVGKRVCAYGVHVNKPTSEIFIFNDLIDEGGDCSTANNTYQVGEELVGQLNYIKLDTKILVIGNSTDVKSPNIVNVVFVPPNITTVINSDDGLEAGSLVIEVIGTANTKFNIGVDGLGNVYTN